MKRAIAFILSLMFVFALIPASALAAVDVTVKVSGDATVSTVADVGTKTNLTAAASYDIAEGTNIEITAKDKTADSLIFTGWTGSSSSKDRTIAFTLEAGKSIDVAANYVSGYAVDATPTTAVTVTTTGANSIGSKWQTGAELIATGATVTVTGTSTFKSWDSANSAPASILPTDLTQNAFSFTMPGSTVTIKANELAKSTVTTATTAKGTLTYTVDDATIASGVDTVQEGKTVKVKVEDPSAGHITDLKVGAETVSVDRATMTASFTMPASPVTVDTVVKYKVTVSVDGSMEEYLLAPSGTQDISAPETSSSNGVFKEWTVSPDTGSFADKTARDTVYTMGATTPLDTTVTATYTNRYTLSYYEDTFDSESHLGTDLVPLKQSAGDFQYWEIYKKDGDTWVYETKVDKAVGTYQMQGHDVQVRCIANYTLTATNAWVHECNPTTKAVIREVINPTKVAADVPQSVSVASNVTYLRVTPITVGSRTFSSWWSNSRRISSQSTANPLYFWMPQENVEVRQNFATYRITLVNAKDPNGVTVEAKAAKANGTAFKDGYGTTLHWDSYHLDSATFIADDAPGGTSFTGWSASGGYIAYTSTRPDGTAATDGTGTHVRLEMPASSGYTVTANYSHTTVDALAYIQVRQQPSKLSYTVGSSFDPTGCEVYYYAPYRNALGQLTDEKGNVVSTAVFKPGVLVSMSNLRFTVVSLDGGTTIASAPFTTAGDYALWVQMVVGGTVMAQLLCFNDQLINCVHVYNFMPSYVKIVQPVPTNSAPMRTMFYGQPFSKDGLDVWIYGEGKTGSYMQIDALNWKDYTLESSMNGTNIPTKAQLDNLWTADNAWLQKKADGNYWINLGHFLTYYYTTDQGKTKLPCLNEITPDGTTPEGVWISLIDGAQTLTVTPASSTAGEIVTTNLASGVNAAWTIKTIGTSATGRKLTLDVTPNTLTTEQKAAAVSYSNTTPGIAYLRQDEKNPLVYYLVPCGTGTTTLTFYRSDVGPDDTQKQVITVTVDAGGASFDNMASFTLNNDYGTDTKPAPEASANLNLYVSNKSTLYVKTYSPATADTRVVWNISFLDGLAPTDVENYVSINETSGEITALKFTSRKLLVTATAVSDASVKRYCVIELQQVAVDGISLDMTTLDMYQYGTYQLKPTITPEGASNKNVIWTTSLGSVVSVSSDGVLTANGLGTAIIKGTCEADSNFSCTLTVTVRKATLLTAIKLNKNAVSMGVGETNTLAVTFTPTTATNQTVTWSTSDASVVTVSAKGKLRGISEGSAIVTATATDGSNMKAQCVVSVTKLVVSAVTLNKQLLSIYTEDEVQLTETVYPTNATNQVVEWSSSNEKIATVDPDGIITGIGAGNCVITATATDGSSKYADCVVVVTKRVPVTGLSLNASSFDLLYNDTAQLAVTVAPSDATYDKVTWTTSDAKIVSVSETGKIGGVGTGSAVVTATAGGKSISITVTVVTKMYSVGTVIRCARRVNVRANASGASAFLGYAYLGDTFRVVEKTGNWYKIQYNATTQGYIWSYYLNAQETSKQYTSAGALYAGTPTPTGSAATTNTLSIVNCTNCINVRSGAATTYKRLGYAFLNETFVYTGKTTDGAWFIIEYGDQVGYVSASFVKVN